MNQLTQKLKSGDMNILSLPPPACSAGFVLVRNHYSLISAGTEASTVKTARASLLQKARERPQQVRQVLEVLRAQGPVQTYRAVMKKLDAYSPLGYSSSGEVIEVGAGVSGFAVGDRVACAGAGYANHAEVIAVPVNLCVRLPDDANLKAAAYNTLGAIALQGIRQADLRLGESCLVIGLGLIGQLTGLMLRASGVRVVGVDVDPAAVETARRHGVDLALERSAPGIADQIARFSGGLGVDAVIITAGSSSLDPVNFAGEAARKKGRVVVVGAVPTGFDRDPHYYRKELELRMSCSYGPGRYDLDYEEKGLDYPAAYVRWTENRNMAAFQDLIHRGRIDLAYLTTHEVPLEEAPQAYDMIVSRSEPFLGVIIRYDIEKSLEAGRVAVQPVGKVKPLGKVNLAFIGAGSYAQGHLLPNLPRNDRDVICRGVMSSTGTTSKRVAERFGFEFCTAEARDILESETVDTVFIATRHDSHGEYALHALRAGKHVFVEKPLALTLAALDAIRAVCLERPDLTLLVGFNRRFAPLAVTLKQRLGGGPMAMLYRVNAGAIPADHWIQDPEIGGGRIIGEVCHFIDLMTFLCGALPVTVYSTALPDPGHLHDTVSIHVTFADGSMGTVAYFANGAKTLNKEYLEVYQSGLTAVLDDFRTLTIHGSGKPEQHTLNSQNKGQAAMIARFLASLKTGQAAPIPLDEIYSVSLATFAAERSLRERLPVSLHPDAPVEETPMPGPADAGD
ncbi:bi-domain-containing oxidoreductase [Allochromatium vinosum]|uniref:bi-domain-containing oxidoreductase n=1 Tax=Allochromatium vinosum TaxID=1049 RepID=UPI001908E432|nr:bi-domain-containing oxidoreductase [Allochromatium vinosum]MBK1655001.1 oxidoreductase [Allochromatium vinosum]